MFLPETDWIKKWAKYTPNKFALREYERSLEWSYFELNERANAIAWWLVKDAGLKRGDRIAVYSKNRAEYVFLFLACIKTGIVLVPLNFRLTPSELDLLIEDAEPSLFLYESSFSSNVSELKAIPEHAKQISIETIASFLVGTVPDSTPYQPDEPITESDLVMILYTAGTTGRSKGVMITHRMLFWNSINTALRLDLNSQDHTQNYAPFFHTGGWNVLTTPFFHAGASVTLLQNFDVDLVLQLMEKERTTTFFGVPTMLQMMSESEQFNKVDLSSVRFSVVGGAPMPEPLINLWHNKGVMIRQGYGLTEVGPNCFSLQHEEAIRKRGSIGFPNFYVDAKIVDADGNELGSNEPGELWLRSPVVTPGYWRNENATAESITDGWFHTGDVVMMDDEGFFYVVDRKKNMFISGGENVYPADVERIIYAHPDVKEVAVVGVQDEKWGEVGKAYISLKEGCSMEWEVIISHCQGKLAKFKIPKYVEFVEELPKNDAGKINRLQLGKEN